MMRRLQSNSVYQIADQTVRGFLRARALEAGAGIAYYSLFFLGLK